ncbi:MULTISPECIES: ABC transporter substrate-binding protein [Pseudofrankia]|uniref:ABC transporter substrate-binding protein n=1 Tax=Pseudofrankia TaxID=2994363 RepID=UPI000234D5DF|nr:MULTISPECIES: ABC transporter substrate-binding protein [Pseudofrankia]OHV35327.1 hypothetical protein BCD49_05185 [Pseudofrankia sp. EUN1h]
MRAGTLSLALAVVAAAGCSAKAGEEGAAAADCAAPGVTPDAVKIGLLYPNTGVLSEAFKSARSGVEGRIGLANQSGGVNGRGIELIWRDDAAAASTNGTAAKELVEKDHVLGLIELSTAVSGSADYLDKSGVPVTGLTAESLWNDHANMFSFSYLFAKGTAVTTFGLYAKAQGGTRAAVLEDAADGPSLEIANQLIASLASQGIETVDRVGYTTGSSSPTRTADEIIDSGADVIVGTVAMSSIADVLAAVRDAGGHPKVVLSPSGYSQALVREQGPAIAGLTIWVNYTPFESASPAIQKYQKAMADFAPELDDPDQEVAVASYISTDLFLRGLEAAGPCPTRQAFITNLRKVTDYDAGGLVPGTINLSQNRGQPNTCYAFVRVNAHASGFEVAKADGNGQWCGQLLRQTPAGNG